MEHKEMPALFVSHGAPTLPLEDIPARAFLKKLGREYSEAKAVLCISAHWETEQPEVNAVEEPETIHDFYGFPRELYRFKYPAKGSVDVAEKVSSLLRKAGITCHVNRERGLDHGAWVPLMLMFPRADVPVVQLSIQHHLDPGEHLRVGLALSELISEDVLIIGSGGAVHPLGYADFWNGKKTDDWALAFDDWLTDAVVSGDRRALVGYRESAPYPERAHPRPDHFMPILTALGAGGEAAKGKVLHRSWYFGDLGMGAYAFRD